MKPTTNMIWHICKKDLKLLWPFVLGAAGIQVTSAGLCYAMDHIRVSEALLNISNLLQLGALLASALLIATVVHQDAIPGVRQDWLVRPLSRRDLLLAKVLFVLLLVHGPILLTDTMEGLLNGFPVGQSLTAAASRSLYLLIGLSLPVLAFASLTRNMAELVIGAVLGSLGFVLFKLFINLINSYGEIGPVMATGLSWIRESVMFAVAVVGSSTVLAIQYFRRKTIRARWLMAVAGFVFLLGHTVPWHFAFAVEQQLSPNPGAGRAIKATFDPIGSKFRLPEGMNHNNLFRAGGLTRDEASTIYLPIRVAGLAESTVLNADRAEVLLTTSDGKMVYHGRADDLLVRKDSNLEPVSFNIGLRRIGWREIGPADMAVPKNFVPGGGEALVYQGLPIPRHLYERIKDQPLRLEINYSLTLLDSSSYSIPALGGDMLIPKFGHCRTQMDDDGDDVQLRCVQAGGESNCVAFFLEHAPSGRRNPIRFGCWPNYSPYSAQYTPDSLTRFEGAVPFRDLAGLAKYPVDAAKLPESRVVLRIYQPQEHFTRRLVIPEIHLSDWESLEHDRAVASR